jgi:hypothetical protein
VTHALRTAAGAIALAFLALHLPFLPPSLEDLDSINFALGIRDFDVARHQPHPPGYPVFMVAAKLVHGVVGSELLSLAILSVTCGALAVIAMAAMMTAMDGRMTAAVAATLLAASTPLYWVTASRPLSDMPGLAAALGVQALVLSARGDRALFVAAALAGLAAGVRSQVVWLTLPVLVLAAARLPGSGRWRRAAVAAAAYAGGALAWFLPLVLASGGPVEYLRTLANQGSEDFTGVVMLWTTPTPRQLVAALLATFLTPWPFPATAAAVFLLGGFGLVVLLRQHRTGLLTLTALFAPYLVFHLLFQETATTRYALPLVVPVAYLAVVGLWGIPGPRQGIFRADRLRVASIVVLTIPLLGGGQAALRGYAAAPAPAFRLLADMTGASASGDSATTPVLAMHRRAAFDFRRPLAWVAPGGPPLEGRLPSPPKREWLEAVKYWNGGGRRPVWFVADPLRSDLALIDVAPPREYRWPSGLAPLVGGARPNEMDWYVIPPPGWYLGEGWALTPETAGVAGEDGRGPGRQPIEGWLRRTSSPSTVLIGGRKLRGAESAKVLIAIDDRPIQELVVSAGFFLELIDLAPGALSGDGDYARLTVRSDSDQVAIEQFDHEPVGSLLYGFGEGWYEAEYNQATGRRWRWTSERAVLRVRSGGQAAVLTLRGEADPSASGPRLIVKVGDRVVVDEPVGRYFSSSVAIPAALFVAGENRITIETNETHVPAEIQAGSGDRRRLGLLISQLTLRAAS